MKDRKNLLYIVSVFCTVLAAAAVIYAFRNEIKEFLAGICARAAEIKEKIADKLCCKYEDVDDEEDIEVEITEIEPEEAEEAAEESETAE